MDSSARAKKAAESRKKGTSSSTSSNSAQNINNSHSISIPAISSSTFEKKKSDSVNIASNVNIDTTNFSVGVSVPNIENVGIDSISERLHGGEFIQISDIKKPDIPEDRQASKAEMENAIAIFERGINYESIVQRANDYVAAQYKSLSSKIKAYKQGLVAATDMEGLKQQLLDFLKAQKITQDKGLAYFEQSHKSATIQTGVIYTIAENESNLERKRLKARKSFEEAKQENEAFDDWLTTLKGKSDKQTN